MARVLKPATDLTRTAARGVKGLTQRVSGLAWDPHRSAAVKARALEFAAQRRSPSEAEPALRGAASGPAVARCATRIRQR